MSPLEWILIGVGATLVLYLGVVVWLVIFGRREEAYAIVRFIPDCVILFRRLLGDKRVPRNKRLLLVAVIAYLASPIDLIPDFVPIAGQLDDALIVALVLRSVLKSAGPQIVRDHWSGPPETLGVILRMAYGAAAA